MPYCIYLPDCNLQMGRRITIDKWSAGYWFIKNILTKPAHLLYYGRIKIKNAGNIPDNQPVILAPNHQNALMDAMVLVLHLKYQSIFLTRADIFKQPLIRRILFFLKMLPIYRIRDGRNSLSKNEEIFDTSVQILINRRNPICLFPEGNHGEHKRLRPLVKGIFRIAFKAQEHSGNHPAVKIVPIGLDYENYYKFGQDLFVNIGKPIEVSEYWDDYLKEPALTTNRLKNDLSDRMKQLMIHIETDQYYDLFLDLPNLYRERILTRLNWDKNSLANRFYACKKLNDKLHSVLESSPETIREISEKYEEYKQLRQKAKLRDWVFRKPAYSVWGNSLLLAFLILLSPLFLAGLILHAPVFFIPPQYAAKNKDPQMFSTLSWGIGYGIGLIYYPLLIILGFLILPKWWLGMLFPLFVLLSGLLAWNWRKLWIKTRAKIRYSLGRSRNKAMDKAAILHREILKHLDRLSME